MENEKNEPLFDIWYEGDKETQKEMDKPEASRTFRRNLEGLIDGASSEHKKLNREIERNCRENATDPDKINWDMIQTNLQKMAQAKVAEEELRSFYQRTVGKAYDPNES